MMCTRRSRSAFTLVELSVVLVIIGILVGGILTGQSLIRSAGLRGVASEYNQFNTAINSFAEKYGGYPGDLRNAVKYWGADGGTSATTEGVVAACANLTASYTSMATCNGNGNNRIAEDDADGDGVTDKDQYYEMYRAWQQLANAGLIEGFYSGGSNRRAFTNQPGINVPQSRGGKTIGWLVRWQPDLAESTGNYFAQSAGTYFYIGSGSDSFGGGFTPEDAWSLDKKLDDGKPGKGNMHSGMLTQNPNCITANSSTADYKSSYNSAACALLIKLQ